MDITQSQILLKIECNGGPIYKKMPFITEKERVEYRGRRNFREEKISGGEELKRKRIKIVLLRKGW